MLHAKRRRFSTTEQSEGLNKTTALGGTDTSSELSSLLISVDHVRPVIQIMPCSLSVLTIHLNESGSR